MKRFLFIMKSIISKIGYLVFVFYLTNNAYGAEKNCASLYSSEEKPSGTFIEIHEVKTKDEERVFPWYPAPLFVHDAMARQIDTISLPKGKHIHLDFEAGRGGYAVHLAKSNPEWHVVALDDAGLAAESALISLRYGASHGESGRFSFKLVKRIIDDTCDSLKNASLYKQELATLEHEIPKLFEERSEISPITHPEARKKLDEKIRATEKRRDDLASRENRGFNYWNLEQFVIVEIIKDRARTDGWDEYTEKNYWQKFYSAKAELLGRQVSDEETYGRWRDYMIRALQPGSDLPYLKPEIVLQFLQKQGINNFYRSSYAPEGHRLNNMTIIRSPTAKENGFTQIPLPDNSVQSLTWIGPYRHVDDYLVIAEEFRRVLTDDWTTVEISVHKGHPERDRTAESHRNWADRDLPEAAVEKIAEILGGSLEKTNDLLIPLTDSFFETSTQLFHYRIYRKR